MSGVVVGLGLFASAAYWAWIGQIRMQYAFRLRRDDAPRRFWSVIVLFGLLGVLSMAWGLA